MGLEDGRKRAGAHIPLMDVTQPGGLEYLPGCLRAGYRLEILKTDRHRGNPFFRLALTFRVASASVRILRGHTPSDGPVAS